MNSRFKFSVACCLGATLLSGITLGLYLLSSQLKLTHTAIELSVLSTLGGSKTHLVESGSIVWLDENDAHIPVFKLELSEYTGDALSCNSVLLVAGKKLPACFVVTADGVTTTNSFSRDGGVYYVHWRGDLE